MRQRAPGALAPSENCRLLGGWALAAYTKIVDAEAFNLEALDRQLADGGPPDCKSSDRKRSHRDRTASSGAKRRCPDGAWRSLLQPAPRSRSQNLFFAYALSHPYCSA